MLSACTLEIAVKSMRRSFTSVDPCHRPHDVRAILKWGLWDRLRGERRVAPPGPPAPRVEVDPDLVIGSGDQARLTWIGHASFLGSLAGRQFLIDPMFSSRAGTFYRRFVEPGLSPRQLPRLEVVLITHNHYDHLDGPSLRALPRDVTVVAPLGLGRWFRGRNRRPVCELGWWESLEVGGLRVTLVPARHWSRRGIGDTNRSLWGGFVLEHDGRSIYHAGDSGWFEGFTDIGRRFPGLLVAILPIGSYAPAWFMEPNHMTPEQAGEAFITLGARHLIPMHWGTFQLTDEPLSEPAERLRSWWQRTVHGAHTSEKELHVMAVGETLVLR